MGATVHLITPALDIIPGILKDHGITPEPLNEFNISADHLCSIVPKQGVKPSALFVVNPNNPTGHTIDEARLKSLADYCKQTGMILVVDNCFRIFRSGKDYDDLAVLRKSGCSFISIEDTGKALFAGGEKVGFLICSNDLHPRLAEHANKLLTAIPAKTFNSLLKNPSI
jgi:aspartate/methionine/tyrosine aminotransferase